MVFGRDFVQRVFPKNFAPFGDPPQVFAHQAIQLASICRPPVFTYGPLTVQRQPDRSRNDDIAFTIPEGCLGEGMFVRLETPEERPIGLQEEGRFPSGDMCAN
jgi:hypothetical protein